MDDHIRLCDDKKIVAFIADLYEKAGVDRETAELHGVGLVEASLRGVDSHGIMRTAAYFERYRKKAINVKPDIKVVAGEKAFVVMDADNASGFVASRYAMEHAIMLAREYHIAAVCVKNSNHFGAAALYAQMAVDAGMVGMASTNVRPNITAPGAKGRVVGNNPFAIGIPTYDDYPFMLDMALSVVAGGKLKMAIRKGEKIPLGWATDVEGNPTDDPKKGFDGYFLPVGGFKGLGIAYVIDMLCGVMTGGAFSDHIKSMYAEPDDPSGTCHMFIAVDCDAIIGKEELRARIAEYRQYIRSIPVVGDAPPLSFPGEIEENRKRERQKNGIPLPYSIYRELEAYAERYQIPFSIEK